MSRRNLGYVDFQNAGFHALDAIGRPPRCNWSGFKRLISLNMPWLR